jgi:hypothetical protein
MCVKPSRFVQLGQNGFRYDVKKMPKAIRQFAIAKESAKARPQSLL